MSRAPDVVVVGGGIVGLWTALASADRGLLVTVVDDSRPGAASRTSAGMLGPSLPGLPASVRNLTLATRDLYPDAVADLTNRSGVRIALDRSGIIEIASSASELDVLHGRHRNEARIDQRQLAELEPALRAHAGAVHHPLDGWVDNCALMDALSIAIEWHPRIQLVRDRVASVGVSHAGAMALLPNDQRIECARIVVATGAWSDLSGLPHRIPVRPIKGELITLSHRPVRHVVYGSRGYLIPRGDTLLVGATSEETHFDATPTVAGREILCAAADSLVAGLSDASVVDHWAGLRPVSPDGMPILGEETEQPALVYACGFSRNGILLAPWAARALSAMLAGDTSGGIPVEFAPARFDENITDHGDLNG
jgi:glycine oxidase